MPNERPLSGPAIKPAGIDAIWRMPLTEGPPSAQAIVPVRPPPAPVPARQRLGWYKAAGLVSGLALAMALAIGRPQWSSAQRRDPPRIVVAPTIVAEPASQAPLIIQVSPLDGLPDNSFVR